MLKFSRTLRIIAVLTVFLALLLCFWQHGSVAEAKRSKVQRTASKRGAARKARPSQKKGPSQPKHSDLLRPFEVKEVEERLRELGYWTGPIDGKLDVTSLSALIAFQKVTGRPRTGKAGRRERAAVMRASRPDPYEKGAAHVEVDLRRQVLFAVDELGVVTMILPVSTGSGEDFFAEGFERTATTPAGRFTIQGKVEGWKKSALGRLYYPNYVIGGIAIHGYPSVPSKPASHGCIRIPMFAAQEFSRLFPIGTLVIVHEGKPIRDAAPEAEDRKRDQEL